MVDVVSQHGSQSKGKRSIYRRHAGSPKDIVTIGNLLHVGTHSVSYLNRAPLPPKKSAITEWRNWLFRLETSNSMDLLTKKPPGFVRHYLGIGVFEQCVSDGGPNGI